MLKQRWRSSGQAFSCSIVACCWFSIPNDFSLKAYVFQGAANANRSLKEGDLGSKHDPGMGSDGCWQWGPLRGTGSNEPGPGSTQGAQSGTKPGGACLGSQVGLVGAIKACQYIQGPDNVWK